MTTSTDLRSDGTITRRLEFHAPASDNAQGPSIGPKADDIFGFPAAPAWKITRAKKDQEQTITAERTFKAGGEIPPDVILKGPKGSIMVSNTLSIRQTAPGRWEYSETLHWKGERSEDLKHVPDQAAAAFKAVLPAELSTPQNIQALSETTLKEIWRALFGPGDPLLSQLMFHPDLAERKIMRRMGAALNGALVTRFADKLTQAQRTEIIRKVVQRAVEDSKVSTKAKVDPQKAQEGSSSPLTAMTFAVKLPGKIVSTNGEVDELSGEVYWALYGEAAAVGDVTMTAVSDTGKQP